MKQLQVFAKCNYEPSSTNEAYREWKRKQEHDVTKFITKVLDTTPILPDQLFVSRSIMIPSTLHACYPANPGAYS
jgi:dual specificity phosphatase 12